MLANLLSSAFVFYLALMAGMFIMQRSLMYYPETHIEPPEHYDFSGAMVVRLATEDGLAIDVWHHTPPKDDFPTILYFHGNAGHVGDRIPKLRHFVDAVFGLLPVSYRAYGKSEGSGTEAGLYEDARTALHYALTELKLIHSDILLYGESLGSGVATHTAYVMAQNGTPAGGLILEAPYTSVARRAQELYPFIPAYYLARDKYHSIDKIDKIACPLLLFHGELDTVIPIHHGRKLLELAKDPKEGVFFDEVDHTQFDYPTLAKHILGFAKNHQLLK